MFSGTPGFIRPRSVVGVGSASGGTGIFKAAIASVTPSDTTLTLDCSEAAWFDVDWNNDLTTDFQNFEAGVIYRIRLNQTSLYTLTLGDNALWAGSAPTLTTNPGEYNIIECSSFDGETLACYLVGTGSVVPPVPLPLSIVLSGDGLEYADSSIHIAYNPTAIGSSPINFGASPLNSTVIYLQDAVDFTYSEGVEVDLSGVVSYGPGYYYLAISKYDWTATDSFMPITYTLTSDTTGTTVLTQGDVYINDDFNDGAIGGSGTNFLDTPGRGVQLYIPDTGGSIQISGVLP